MFTYGCALTCYTYTPNLSVLADGCALTLHTYISYLLVLAYGLSLTLHTYILWFLVWTEVYSRALFTDASTFIVGANQAPLTGNALDSDFIMFAYIWAMAQNTPVLVPTMLAYVTTPAWYTSATT